MSLGASPSCPAAAAQPSGAGVVAAPVGDGLSVALREPGGAWGQAIKLALPADVAVTDLATAVSPRGDALVIWTEQDSGRRHGRMRVRVKRRTASGESGAPQTLAIADLPSFAGGLSAAIADDGTAIVTWSHTTGTLRDLHAVTDTAIAPPGATLHAGQRLSAKIFGAVRLAVAGDGHALVAFGETANVRIAERAPGGGFGAPQTLGGGGAPQIALALGSGDEALVAWGGGGTSSITYARRTGASGFGPPIELRASAVGGDELTGDLDGPSARAEGPGPPRRRGRLQPARGPRARRRRHQLGKQNLARGHRLERRARGDGDGRRRRRHPDARRSVARRGLDRPDRARERRRRGRLGRQRRCRRARAPRDRGRDRTPRPAVDVRVGPPEDTVLRRTQALVIPVTCSAACDIRAEARGLSASASLTRAGTVRLHFLGRTNPAPLRAARVPITVLAGPPGARDVPARVIRPRLRRIPDPPLPRISGLTAVRHGATVDVTWNVNRSARDVGFVVVSSTTRDLDGAARARFVSGSSKRSYHVRLSRVPSKARYVLVQYSRDGGGARQETVRIR